MKKNAASVQMSYDVTVAEKHQAKNAIICFNYANKKLKKASDHLNIMKTSFKDNPEVPTEEIIKTRAAIRRYRDESVKNFNDFKQVAFKCVKVMQTFGSDTQIIKIMKSYINSVDELEEAVNDFVDLFDDLNSKEFTKNIVSSIEKIQDKSEEIDKLVEERIISYVQENILASSWVDAVGDELNMKLEHKKPLILELFNRREDQLNDTIKERNNLVQG
jgi:hypothetical protein